MIPSRQIEYYHVAHICCCDACKGRLWSHSQADWDNHLRYVASDLILLMNPQNISRDAKKQKKQIKMLAHSRRKLLRNKGLTWRKFPNGYWYVGTDKELDEIATTF